MKGLVPLMLSIILMNLGRISGAAPSYNNTLFQGDIILSEAQWKMLYGDGGDVTTHNAYTHGRWPTGRIPYYISSRFSNERRGDIERAMQTYREKKKTCIDFVPVPKNSREHHVYIKPGEGCSSSLGKQSRQQITLGTECSFGT